MGNEAYLSVKAYPDDYEIVTPSISILAQPSVAIVDSVVDKKGTREVATEYLNYLYSDETQETHFADGGVFDQIYEE